MDQNYYWQEKSWREKLVDLLEGIWPTIHRLVNDGFYGAINLLKTFITAIWR